MTSVTRSETVSASPQDVWAVISDLPGMGSLSPEATGGTWVKGDGPAVGSVFKGKNARGKRSWSTKAKVTAAAPGSSFAFDVSFMGLAVSTWAYALEADGASTRVTETWTDRRPGFTKPGGKLVTGVSDREGYTATSIEHTLAALKARFC